MHFSHIALFNDYLVSYPCVQCFIFLHLSLRPYDLSCPCPIPSFMPPVVRFITLGMTHYSRFELVYPSVFNSLSPWVFLSVIHKKASTPVCIQFSNMSKFLYTYAAPILFLCYRLLTINYIYAQPFLLPKQYFS